MARQRFSDEDDDRDDRPRDRRDEGEDRPRPRRPRDDDEYDDRRGPLKKPGLATAAGVLWVIWGALAAILCIARVVNFGKLAALPTEAMLLSIAEFLFIVAGTALCFVAGVRTLNGGASSIRTYGALSLVFCIVFVLLYTALAAYLASVMGAVAGAPAAGLGAAVVVVTCGVVVIMMSGMILASIFAMSSSKKYELWWRATKGRSRGDY